MQRLGTALSDAVHVLNNLLALQLISTNTLFLSKLFGEKLHVKCCAIYLLSSYRADQQEKLALNRRRMGKSFSLIISKYADRTHPYTAAELCVRPKEKRRRLNVNIQSTRSPPRV
jgi:hypothetical protein